VWIAKQIPADVAEEVRRLAPHAVSLVPDFARIYPQGTLAAPVIGFTGREELLTVGRAGLEHSFDAVLAGQPDQYLAIKDAIQRQVLLRRLHRGRPGSDLELTLSARLQARSEAAVAASIAEYGARAGSAVVVDVRTGGILALVSLPAFDPSNPSAVPPENWRLRPVQDAIEPGSTVKPIVAAAALAADVVRDDERFDCMEKGIRVAGHWVRDHAEPGMYTIDEIIVHSANVGIIRVADRLQETMLWGAFDAFGFGRRTGIDYPAEARGLLPETAVWSKLSPSGFALGQELTASPLQVAMAYAAIANGGWLRQPHLLPRGRAADDMTAVRVLDERLAARMSEMLEAVVHDGTGGSAHVAGFRVAGKTGTAQKAVGGGFDDQHHIAWFAGFLPLPEPAVAVVVVIEEPQVNDFWASTVAAPVFAEIAEAAMCFLDRLPTEPVEALPAAVAEHGAGDAETSV
jgi:cell division protein FtsI/penicillin-binding protein 2